MTATYRLSANQIGINLLNSIKDTFGNNEIELVVHTLDETDHLLSTKANRDHLTDAIERSKETQNIVTVDIKELD